MTGSAIMHRPGSDGGLIGLGGTPSGCAAFHGRRDPCNAAERQRQRG